MKNFKLFKVNFKMALLAASMFILNKTEAQKWGDYTLIAPTGTTTAYLLDTTGATYHTWTLTGATTYTCHMLPGGTLVRSVTKSGNSFTGGPISGQVQKVDWDGNILWNYVYSTTTYCSHHDICPMPNGNVLLIAYESKTAAEATAAGSTKSIVMWPDKIVEIKPTGATTGDVVWEWHAWDHLVQNVDSTKANYKSSVIDNPQLLNINYSTAKDWMHMNGVDYNEELDQIAFSSHNLNEIYVIDHSTTTAEAAGHTGGKYGKGGDFLYRWGNPAAYGATGTKILSVVHDAHWIPDGCPKAGYLVGFNNQGVSTSKSAVDLVSPPYTSSFGYTLNPGEAVSPANYTWRHAANGYTSNEGGSQQLPNGNMIVCIAKSGIVYEIDSNQTVLWTKTISGSLAQASRYSKCYTTGTLATTPTITNNNNILTSSSANSYQWYKNGLKIEGQTSTTFTPTESAFYQVQVTDNNGCESKISKRFIFSTTGGGTSVETIKTSTFKIYPNPTEGIINLDVTNTSKYEVMLFDLSGKMLFNTANVSQIDLSNVQSGIYFITIITDNGSKLTQKIVLSK